MGILILDELGEEGAFRVGSKRYKKFVSGKKVGLTNITKRRLEENRGLLEFLNEYEYEIK